MPRLRKAIYAKGPRGKLPQTFFLLHCADIVLFLRLHDGNTDFLKRSYSPFKRSFALWANQMINDARLIICAVLLCALCESLRSEFRTSHTKLSDGAFTGGSGENISLE